MAHTVRHRLFKNAYRDSVELMRIAAEIERLPGVRRAGLMMATEANLAVLAEAGLVEGPVAGARAGDLIVAVAAADAAAAAAALDRAETSLRGPAPASSPERGARLAGTLSEAFADLPGANLALISTPGAYATAEALKALKRGLHVFLFSDNVPVADEVALKRLAERKGLLMMGPDCGTAILDGVPLGFANVIRRGRIGLIGASGTGIQQVSCLIDGLDEGVSQAIGVGGRDLDEQVGGLMTLTALCRLAGDADTAVIVLISKPPAPAVAERVLAAARACHKPVVVNFLGWDGAAGVASAFTFEEAALRAVAMARGIPPARLSLPGGGEGAPRGVRLRGPRLAPGQDAIRGLYCGGSLAGEAKLVLERQLGGARAARCRIVDLGADEYTVGRPHPMIDPRLRNQELVRAARSPRVAVILFDVVLGYNAHPDPAGALVPAIDEARRAAGRTGRPIVFVASVCGTPADPQDARRQAATLTGAGVLLAPSNARAAALAARIVARARSSPGARTAVAAAPRARAGGLPRSASRPRGGAL